MMNDPSAPQSSDQPSPADRPRAGIAETLRHALRSLSGDRSSAPSGGLSPEALTELAQRAGLNSPGQVAELARMMGMEPGTVIGDGTPQHIVFLLGDIECALPAATVQGVERLGDVTPVPNTVPWVLGIVHLRGSIISVVDLRGYFDLPPQPLNARSRLLVVAKREMTIGLVVDAVTEMRALDSEHVEQAQAAATPAWARDYALQTINLEGRSVVLLDPERLLFADKMHRYRADLA
jgi:purine-binding chemotaxis protein CheW